MFLIFVFFVRIYSKLVYFFVLLVYALVYFGTYKDLVDYLKAEASDNKSYLLEYIKPLEQYGTENVVKLQATSGLYFIQNCIFFS